MTHDVIDFSLASLVGLLGWFFGGLDGFVIVLLVFCITDYITGMFAAGVERKLSSSVGFKGIAKKIVMFSLVGVAHVLDRYILGNSGDLRAAVCLFYVWNEGISIIENAKRMGIPIPRVLNERLAGLTMSGKKKVK